MIRRDGAVILRKRTLAVPKELDAAIQREALIEGREPEEIMLRLLSAGVAVLTQLRRGELDSDEQVQEAFEEQLVLETGDGASVVKLEDLAVKLGSANVHLARTVGVYEQIYGIEVDIRRSDTYKRVIEAARAWRRASAEERHTLEALNDEERALADAVKDLETLERGAS